jgi:hypothetical protein
VSLLGFGRGEAPFERRVVHSVYGSTEQDVRHCVTDGVTKYIWNRRGGMQEMYRPADDPGETRNLAADPANAAELASWRATLVETLQRAGATYCLDGDALAALEAEMPGEAALRAADRFGRRQF